MKLRLWLLWICISFSLHILQAQQFFFETLTTKNGLSSNEISCIYEDRDHFLWVGTRDGLNRFDGRKFEVFRNHPQDSNSISGNVISAVLQDSSGIIWIATKDGGLSRYDAKAPDNKKFTQFRHSPKDTTTIATNRLNCLYDWDENYLAIGAEMYSCIFLNKKTLQFTYWRFNDEEMKPEKALTRPAGFLTWVHHFYERDGKVYFSLLHSGMLFCADKTTGKITRYTGSNSISGSVQQFFVTGSKIWMAGWNPGLFVQDNQPLAEQKKLETDNDLLMCVADYNSLYMLAGSRGSGLFRVNKNTGEAVQFTRKVGKQSSLPSNKILSMHKDSRGILWVGTSAGLARYDPRAWLFSEAEFTDAQTDLTILRTHRFNDGSVAVNTSLGMFLSDEIQFSFDRIKFTNRNFNANPDFLLHLQNDKYLLGTEIGFYEWQYGSSKIKECIVDEVGTHRDFYSETVFQVKDIIRDTVNGEPGFWMAVLGYGIGFYSEVDYTYYPYYYFKELPKSLGNSLARKVILDKKGNLWVATSGGLYMRKKNTPLEKNEFEGYVNDPANPLSIPGNDIMGLWCDKNNHIWMSISGRGLCEFDGKKFTLYQPTNSASSLMFFGIHADKRQRLWIVTRNGLEVFDLKAKKFFHLDVNDGSANTNLSPQFSNETKHEVSFAAGNRVFTFKPDAVKFDTTYPPLYLAEMKVFDKSFLTQATEGLVKLKANERFIDFSVSAIQYTFPQTVRFQYKLEGLEADWKNSDDGEIKYTNLPWGKFKLWVRVTNPSGQFGGDTILAEFKIATPFYYTWWFYLLVATAIAAGAFAFYKYRINQLMKLQSIRNKIARDLHDDIGSTLGSISFLSEAAKQQLEQNNSTGAQKMLQKIGSNSREMVESMSDIVWSVNPKNDTAKFLMERMRVFAADLVAPSAMQLHFNAEKQAEEVKLTMEQRKNIFLIFKETVYNSVKYSEAKNLYVEVKKTATGVTLIIKDDGKGFDVNNYKSKNGNGIKNMRYRAEEVEARFDVFSTAQGTVTTISV
ncbi:MAG: hypothetical protein JNK66_08510 [Chitinophagales bacterium]|nr:hypothetical protein [Chitinophagales bacterium]